MNWVYIIYDMNLKLKLLSTGYNMLMIMVTASVSYKQHISAKVHIGREKERTHFDINVGAHPRSSIPGGWSQKERGKAGPMWRCCSLLCHKRGSRITPCAEFVPFIQYFLTLILTAICSYYKKCTIYQSSSIFQWYILVDYWCCVSVY